MLLFFEKSNCRVRTHSFGAIYLLNIESSCLGQRRTVSGLKRRCGSQQEILLDQRLRNRTHPLSYDRPAARVAPCLDRSTLPRCPLLFAASRLFIWNCHSLPPYPAYRGLLSAYSMELSGGHVHSKGGSGSDGGMHYRLETRYTCSAAFGAWNLLASSLGWVYRYGMFSTTEVVNGKGEQMVSSCSVDSSST